jgi:hypothetical protein
MLALLSACGGEPGKPTSTPASALAAAPMPAPSVNTMTFPNSRTSYRIEPTATGFQVSNFYPTSSDTPVQVSADARLIFSDHTVNLGMAKHAKTMSNANLRAIVELYVAFLNRVPDADGMVYWIQKFNAGMTFEQMANNFYTAAIQYPELTGYSSAMSNAEFVRVIYKNVLGRSGSNAPLELDVNYWAGELSSGKVSKGALVLAMLNSAHSFEGDPTWGWVAKLLNKKIELGFYFAVEHGLAYVYHTDAITKGMEILAQVTANNDLSIRNSLGIKDSSFDLLMATPTGSGLGNSLDCINPNLYKEGTSIYTEKTTINRWSSLANLVSERFTATGVATFDGKVVQEFVTDTTHLSGYNLGNRQLKSYIGFTNNELLTYGSVETIKNYADYDFHILSTNTPAERLPFSLSVNQAFTKNYAAKVERYYTSISTNTYGIYNNNHEITDTATFLGIEPVVTPAGTFNACKIRHVRTDSFDDMTDIVDSYSWIVSEGIWRGMLVKVDSPYKLMEITKIRFN